MRICVLTHTFPRNKTDVTAAFMKEFCDGLVENNHQVTVVTPFDQKFHRKDDKFKIITYKYIWPERLHILGYSQTMEEDLKLKKRAYFLLPFLIIFAFLTLLKTVKTEKIELISVHWIIPNGLIALLVSKICHISYVVTLPGTDAYLAYRHRLIGLISKIIANHSAGIISNSSYHLKRIINLGIKNKPNQIISYPIDISQFHPLKNGLIPYRSQLKLTTENIIILAVGRLVYKKGFDYLIKAMPKVLKKISQACLIIGGEGDLKNHLINLIYKLNLQDKIFLIGSIPRDKIIFYYNLADIMVAPSVIDKNGNIDGGPVVSFESMACGKPQIVTSILGVADYLKNNVNGYIIQQKNIDALAEAIIKLAVSKKNRDNFGKNNRKLVCSQFGTKYIGKVYSDFFKQALIGYDR